ncbi:MAG: hypothetical protein ACRC0G_03510, partial [Fusobacteriaceae bacterium]
LPTTVDALAAVFSTAITQIRTEQQQAVDAEQKIIDEAMARQDAAAAELAKASVFTENMVAMTTGKVVIE